MAGVGVGVGGVWRRRGPGAREAARGAAGLAGGRNAEASLVLHADLVIARDGDIAHPRQRRVACPGGDDEGRGGNGHVPAHARPTSARAPWTDASCNLSTGGASGGRATNAWGRTFLSDDLEVAHLDARHREVRDLKLDANGRLLLGLVVGLHAGQRKLGAQHVLLATGHRLDLPEQRLLLGRVRRFADRRAHSRGGGVGVHGQLDLDRVGARALLELALGLDEVLDARAAVPLDPALDPDERALRSRRKRNASASSGRSDALCAHACQGARGSHARRTHHLRVEAVRHHVEGAVGRDERDRAVLLETR